jgi:hypothetical protein
MCEQVLTHKWQEAGLGQAPFKVVGAVELPSKSLATANPDAFNNALKMIPRELFEVGLGTCAVCGQGIMINMIIKAADGRRFPVGTDCVRKAGDTKLTTKAKQLENARRREKAAKKREAAREARLQEQRDRNGGKTDQEIRQEKSLAQERKYEAARENAISILTPVAADLADGKGRFRDNVASDLRLAVIPSPRAVEIIGEILGSAATDKIEQAQQILTEARA